MELVVVVKEVVVVVVVVVVVGGVSRDSSWIKLSRISPIMAPASQGFTKLDAIDLKFNQRENGKEIKKMKDNLKSLVECWKYYQPLVAI